MLERKFSRNFILIFFLTIIVSSAKSQDQWWLIGRGLLARTEIENGKWKLDQNLRPATRRSVFAIDQTDGTCWTTDSFQGQILRISKSGPLEPIGGFAAPISIAFDHQNETFWVADGALNFVAEISRDGKILGKIEVPSPKAVIAKPSGGCLILTWRGLHAIRNDRIGEIILPKVKIVSSSKNAIWATTKKGSIFKITDSDIEKLQFGLPDLIDIAATADGGCWLLRPEMAIRIDRDLKLVGELTDLKNPKKLIFQPSDQSVWLIDSSGNRAVLLPHRDADLSSLLTALIGWRDLDRTKKLGQKTVSDLTWTDFRSVVEPPPPPPIAVEPEPIIVDEPPKPPPPIFVEPKPEPKPTIVDPPKPETEPIKNETDPNDQINETEKEKLEEKSDVDQLKVIEIQPGSIFDPKPNFENGGITSLEVFGDLSQKRLRDTDQAFGRRFVWNFENKSHTLIIGLSADAYNVYSNLDRKDWVSMVLEGSTIGNRIGSELSQIAKKNSWSREKLANFVLAFVQSLPYTIDDVSTGYNDYKFYSFETLVDGGGDCEDTTILTASILISLDFNVTILNPKGHLALGVDGNFEGAFFAHNGKKFYYAETTGNGWLIGEIPDQYNGVPVVLHEVPKLKN